MAAINFPGPDERDAYTSTPWVDVNGRQWLWNADKERWEPVVEGGSTVTWSTLSGKPDTFPPTIGTTSTTAAAGDHNHNGVYASLGTNNTFTGEIIATAFRVIDGQFSASLVPEGLFFEDGGSDMTLRVGAVPNGTGAGDAYFARTQNNDGSLEALDVGASPITEIDAVETGTTYSLDADDLWRMKQFSNASGCAVTVPSGLGSGFEEIFLHRQPTAGALTLTHSITIDNSAAISTVAAGGTCCLKRKASNHWILI
jgi:hypothetical protein